MGEPLAHPFVSTAAICDVITPDVVDGPNAASAEMLTLIDECLGLFPNLARTYEVRVSHSKSKIYVMPAFFDANLNRS